MTRDDLLITVGYLEIASTATNAFACDIHDDELSDEATDVTLAIENLTEKVKKLANKRKKKK